MISRIQELNRAGRGAGGLTRVALMALACLGLLFVAALSQAPAAQAQDGPARSAINSDLTIEKGEVVEGDVSVTGGKLTVYGEVRGKVAVLNGSARVDGKVQGDVAVIGGD